MLDDVKRAPSADAARLGEPSYVWRSGQERRLQLIRRYVPLEDRRILDVGCGIGTYVRRFRDFSPQVYGLDLSTANSISPLRTTAILARRHFHELSRAVGPR